MPRVCVYSSPVCGMTQPPQFLTLLDRVEAKAFRLIKFPSLTDSPKPPFVSSPQSNNTLSLMYFFVIFTGHCYSEFPMYVYFFQKNMRQSSSCSLSSIFCFNFLKQELKFPLSLTYTQLWNTMSVTYLASLLRLMHHQE